MDNLYLVSQGYCPNCQQRYFSYDALSRLTAATNPESGTVSYSYDANGNLISKTDARGITASYSFDALNRLVSKSYSDSTPAVTYKYDDRSVPNSAGQLPQVTNGISTTKYLAYATLGRVTGSQQLISDEAYNFSYTYNLAGSLLSETYPSGRVVNTGYDAANRVSSVIGNFAGQQTTYASGVSYAPHGAPTFFWYGNQVARVFTYTNRLSLNSYWDAFQNSPNSYLFAVQENWGTTQNNGNLLSETVWEGGPGPLSSLPQFNRNYTYDTLNRLTAAQDGGGWSRAFAYDTWSNMWVTSNSGVPLAGNTPTAIIYNSNNQISGASYSYDTAGNLLVANGDTLTYDAENRQSSATESPNLGGGQELYLYDGDGQRVEKVGVAGNTIYVYDAFGGLTAEYNTFASSPVCTPCYFTTDQLGSVRMVTDQNGNVVARHDFLPFGEEVLANTAGRNGQWGSTTDAEQKFTGQIRDEETGIDFFNARYLTAPLGRFNSADPENAGSDALDPQTWNAYSYVRNNPLIYTDPTGESFLSIFKEIAGAVAIGFGVLSGLGVGWAAPIAQIAGLASGQAQIAGMIVNHSVPAVVAAPMSEQAPLPYPISNPGQFTNEALRVSIYDGANGFGHAGIGVNSDSTYGLYPTSKPACLIFGCSVPGKVQRDHEKYRRTIVIKTTPEQDRKAQEAIDRSRRKPPAYNLYHENCASFVESVLDAAGVTKVPTTILPNQLGNALGCKP